MATPGSPALPEKDVPRPYLVLPSLSHCEMKRPEVVGFFLDLDACEQKRCVTRIAQNLIQTAARMLRFGHTRNLRGKLRHVMIRV
jgi:hypothetical protein